MKKARVFKMSFKPLTCPNCGAQIQLDSSNDFGFCMYCGSKIMLTQKINIEHSGSVSIGNIDLLIKRGFREIDQQNFKVAEETFNKAADIDCDNPYVMIGQMFKFSPFSESPSIAYDSKKIKFFKSKYSSLTSYEKNVINQDNCSYFFVAYCYMGDIARVDWLMKKYNKNDKFYINVGAATMAIKSGCNLLPILLNNGVDENIIFEEFFRVAYKEDYSGARLNVNEFPIKVFKVLIESGHLTDKKKITYFHKGVGEKYYFELNRFVYALTSKGYEYTDDIMLIGDPEKIDEYVKYIEKLQFSGKYIEPQKQLLPKGKDHLSRCYVATAVYGSYDCPEVWTLRRFRDNILSKSLFGRLFIFLYYSISPKLVEWFGDTDWFKNMWRPFLDKMVNKLNHNGVENTPYNDHQW